MKASVIRAFGDVDALEIVNLPDPTPDEGEVLVRVRAAGVNPVDWKIRQGFLKDFLPTVFPAVLGWDLAGTVVAVGHAARRFSVGNAVYGYARRPVVEQGTYAEYICLPESYLCAKPSNLTYEEAAAVPLVALTAYQSLFSAAQLATGESVLILGASGGVGGFAVQLARAHGTVVAAVASKRNHPYLQSLGAQLPLDYNDSHWVDQLLKASYGGVDVIIDCIGGPTLTAAVPALRNGGRVVSICDTKAGALFADKQAKFHYVFVEPNSLHLDILRGMLESGKLTVSVSDIYPLERVRDAHRAMQSGHTRGKIVLTM